MFRDADDANRNLHSFVHSLTGQWCLNYIQWRLPSDQVAYTGRMSFPLPNQQRHNNAVSCNAQLFTVSTDWRSQTENVWEVERRLQLNEDKAKEDVRKLPTDSGLRTKNTPKTLLKQSWTNRQLCTNMRQHILSFISCTLLCNVTQ